MQAVPEGEARVALSVVLVGRSGLAPPQEVLAPEVELAVADQRVEARPSEGAAVPSASVAAGAGRGQRNAP